LYHVYKANGQYKKSLEAFQLFILARDSVSDLANAKAAIGVESEEGKGSTFFIQLPIVVARAEEVKEGFITKERLKTSLSKLLVLELQR
jgi:hypothetical protein